MAGKNGQHFVCQLAIDVLKKISRGNPQIKENVSLC